MNRQKIAQRVKVALEIRHMRQNELAERAGVTASTVSNVINGGSYSKMVIKRIGDALEMDPRFLMGEVGAEIKENIPPRLFGACVNVAVEALEQEKIEVSSYKQVIKLALDLCGCHQEGKMDIFTEVDKANSFLLGAFKQQLEHGIIKRRADDEEEITEA
jgi:transcriptional regulator with XRE-family HTH domain